MQLVFEPDNIPGLGALSQGLRDGYGRHQLRSRPLEPGRQGGASGGQVGATHDGILDVPLSNVRGRILDEDVFDPPGEVRAPQGDVNVITVAEEAYDRQARREQRPDFRQ